MDLIRLDSNPHPNPDKEPQEHRQTEFELRRIGEDFPEDAQLRVNFSRFGLGAERRPNFAVQVSWRDVRCLVREFIEMGHPEALYLQSLILLANKIEKAGWSPNDPAPQDFWEIMPSISN
jgi:hypothetical protein